MTEKIREGIYRIPVELPRSPLKLLNSYVITGGDRNLLIDTGFRNQGCLDSMMAGINELGLDMSKTDILLTHLHSDHAGLAPVLAEPTSRVYLSRGEVPWLCGESQWTLWMEDNRRYVRAGFSKEQVMNIIKHSNEKQAAAAEKSSMAEKMSAASKFEDYLPIDEGDEFICGDYCLKAVATPGHTPLHMCFWLENEKIMLTGDHVLFDITPNITLWQGVDDSLGDFLESLRKIDGYDVELALPGHRGRGDFHERVDQLIKHHDRRLDECLGIVEKNPGLSVYDIAGRMSWKIRCSSWEDFPMGQKWFAVGECHSHLRHLERLGKIAADESEEVIRFFVK